MTYDEAVKYCRRFIRQRGFPQDDAAVVDLALDLQRVCTAHPVDPDALADRWNESSPFVPTLHELMTMAAEMPRAGSWKPASESCGLCRGTGYRTIEKRSYEAVIQCSCVTEEKANG